MPPQIIVGRRSELRVIVGGGKLKKAKSTWPVPNILFVPFFEHFYDVCDLKSAKKMLQMSPYLSPQLKKVAPSLPFVLSQKWQSPLILPYIPLYGPDAHYIVRRRRRRRHRRQVFITDCP
jgi:hypothetical protein